MSSQKMDVSSNEESSDNAQTIQNTKNGEFLSPNWSSFRKQQKNKAKSTCGLSSKKGSQQQQILFYKEKAHQSFMQIIQVQQLHQEEIQQVREQYERKISVLEKELKQKNQIIEVFQKNSNSNLIDFKKNLELQEIGAIQCRQNYWTRFDQSTILTFKEFLSQKEGDAKISSMQEQIFGYVKREISKVLPNGDQLIKNIKKEINSIFQYVKQVRQQLLIKAQSHDALIKKYEQNENNYKKLKSKFQSVQKDAVLMSQNLRKIKEEKNLMQRKNLQLQKKINFLQKEIRCQVSTKQNNLKLTSYQQQKSCLYSKKLIESHKHIGKNEMVTLKTIKNNDFQRNLRNDNKQKSLAVPCKHPKFSKNEDSFDVQDLIEEINFDNKNSSLKVDKNQKKTQLMVSQINRMRKKSFDN